MVFKYNFDIGMIWKEKGTLNFFLCDFVPSEYGLFITLSDKTIPFRIF